jgi:hypothetical protein
MEPSELEDAQQEYEQIQSRAEQRAERIEERTNKLMREADADFLIECLTEMNEKDREYFHQVFHDMDSGGRFSSIGAVIDEAIENHSHRVAEYQIDSEE